MARLNLIQARNEKELSQQMLADSIGVDIKSISRWETGTHEPQAPQKKVLRSKLGNDDPDLFKNFEVTEKKNEEPTPPQPCYQMDSHDKVDSSDSLHFGIQESEEEQLQMNKPRRGMIGTAVTSLSSIALVSNVQIVTGPTVDTGEFLELCESSIPTWWSWLYGGNKQKLEQVLNRHVPTLKRLATTISPFQKNAASLAVETKVMQIRMATGSLQFDKREQYCAEAVELGALSGDRNLVATAWYWYGDTYTYCYHESQTAISHLDNALVALGDSSEPSLVRSKIYSDLAIAHAQYEDERNKKDNERQACDYIEMARNVWPTVPELDSSCSYNHVGLAERDQFEGKVYLSLAERFPDSKYAQQAYDAFEESISKQAASRGMEGQAYIRRADAARVLGDLDHCVEYMIKGLRITSSLDRLAYAHNIITSVPDKWQKETPIKKLRKNITETLIEARR